jgi:hypothetical protein
MVLNSTEVELQGLLVHAALYFPSEESGLA